MLASILALTFAPDHWFEDEHPGHAESEAHERHCHGNLAGCSDVPLTTVGGLAALAAWLAVPGLRFVVRPQGEDERVPEGRAMPVEVPPPRGAWPTATTA